ncbi:hypothetical protein [Halocatena salina]|uniref:Uncharacterized protein n=1 Tax=Halocatena salina TaxID=2934340 RepID=A0A8U0A467_9EURY|nr:hypothetical protein [Halocatena salina]UPM42733.1 hypothetical protein MW046_12340 [Halocatena salina]
MGHAELAEMLRDDPVERDLTALSDGSTDVYYRIMDAHGDYLSSREAFDERIAAGVSETFTADRSTVTIGGRAVNMAHQAYEFGDTIALRGHLDDHRFALLRDRLDGPATVYVYDFDGDLTTQSQTSVVALCRALETLEQSYDVVVSANGAETAYLREALSIEEDDPEAMLRQFRNELAG